MAYLVQNRSGYCFRLSIPLDLQSQVGLKEIRRSLRCHNHRTASQLSLLLAGKVHQLLRQLRRNTAQLTQLQVKQAIDRFIRNCLDAENYIPSDTIETGPPFNDEPKTIPSDNHFVKNLVNDWMTENIRGNKWKPRTIKAYKGHWRVMLQILGKDFTVESFDHLTVRAIKETLLRLPSGMNVKGIFAGKTISKIIKINEAKQFDTLSISSVNRYLITLGAFFKWCIGNGYMTTNYAEGKKIPTKRRRPDEVRDAFTTDDLQTIFGAPGYTDDPFDAPWMFWLPILGLYTGARLNELCQLRLDDLKEIGSLYCFSFQDDTSDDSIRVKTESSNRIVPIHPFVINELNFKGYVKRVRSQDQTRLFPELPYQNDNYGHKASKWFRAFRHSIGLDSPKLVYHSFRHTLTDNLKQKLVNVTVIDELTGHSVQGESLGRYGKRYRPDVLYKEAILKLDFGIDLSHLMDHKQVMTSNMGI